MSRFLFAGDIDDSVFIVQSGKLNVLINNSDGTSLSLKHVKSGESVTSLLSFIDVLAVSLYSAVHTPFCALFLNCIHAFECASSIFMKWRFINFV